jgi:hypothetical protein
MMIFIIGLVLLFSVIRIANNSSKPDSIKEAEWAANEAARPGYARQWIFIILLVSSFSTFSFFFSR